jgi:para-aminobenzoate synthetase/4-amino-4-deoxychorismate lyase
MLVHEGRPVELEAHLARLAASAAGLYGARLSAGVVELVTTRARALPIGRLRLIAVPNGHGALVTDVHVAPVDTTIVFPDFTGAARLTRLEVPGGIGAHKWADRRLLQQAEAGGSLPLILDADGSVLEASRANVFVVEDGTIFTPPADGRILPGVTRRSVLDLLPVWEEPIGIDRLLAADEVFLSGSVRGIEPVWELDSGRTWPAGTVTPLVSAELRRHWEMDR